MKNDLTTARVTIIDRIRGYFEMRRYKKQIAARRKALDAILKELPKKPCYIINENGITY